MGRPPPQGLRRRFELGRSLHRAAAPFRPFTPDPEFQAKASRGPGLPGGRVRLNHQDQSHVGKEYPTPGCVRRTKLGIAYFAPYIEFTTTSPLVYPLHPVQDDETTVRLCNANVCLPLVVLRQRRPRLRMDKRSALRRLQIFDPRPRDVSRQRSRCRQR